MIGVTQYEWSFVGSDINAASIKSAKKIVNNNSSLANKVKIKKQNNIHLIFKNIIQNDEKYDLTLCNPPFHRCEKDAIKGSQRKVINLNKNKALPLTTTKNLNFGGTSNELWYEGGELAFIKKMIKESIKFSTQVLWFTSLVSKKENIPLLKLSLKKLKCSNIKVIKMAQGQKNSRFIAWSFLNENEIKTWCNKRFNT